MPYNLGHRHNHLSRCGDLHRLPDMTTEFLIRTARSDLASHCLDLPGGDMASSEAERFTKRARKNGLVDCVGETMVSLRRDDPNESDVMYLESQAMDECLEKCGK